MKKNLIFIIIIYVLVLLQASFFVHFNFFFLNFVFLSVILLNLFEKLKSPSGLIISLIGGLLLDIYSSRPIGFYVLILGITAIFIKFFLRKYVRIPFAKTT